MEIQRLRAQLGAAKAKQNSATGEASQVKGGTEASSDSDASTDTEGEQMNLRRQLSTIPASLPLDPPSQQASLDPDLLQGSVSVQPPNPPFVGGLTPSQQSRCVAAEELLALVAGEEGGVQAAKPLRRPRTRATAAAKLGGRVFVLLYSCSEC